MTAKHFQVLRSENGDLSIFDETDEFMASFKNGQWIESDVFEFRELEQFILVTDDHEAMKLLSRAREALKR